MTLIAQQQTNIVEKNDIIVYITKTGKKYHTSACSYLKKGGIPIKLFEAKDKYLPCSRCNPPSLKYSEQKNVQIDTASNKKSSDLIIVDTKKEKYSETTKSGKTIYTGPRGGKYHYSKSGKKVYEKKKK